MKTIPSIAVLSLIFSNLPVIADEHAELPPLESVKSEMLDAGFGIESESETPRVSTGQTYNSLIFPARGTDALVHAVANDSNAIVQVTIYNDANGNLIDRVRSDESDLNFRFVPDGDLYRVKVEIVAAKAPTSIRIITASRSTELPPATGVIASIQP